MVAILALAPLPFGGNFPLAEAVIALAVGLAALVHGLLVLSRPSAASFGPGSLLAAVLWLALLGFLVIQVIPLPGLPAITLPETGARIEMHTISVDPGDTWITCLRLLSYGVLAALLMAVARRTHRARFLVRAVFFIVAIYAVLGLLLLKEMGDTLLFVPKWAYQGDATATFINKNSFATFLGFGMVAGISFLFDLTVPPESTARPERRDWTPVVAVIVCLVFILAALMATHSRMGIFSSLMGCGVVICLGLAKAKLRKSMLLAAALFVGAAIAAVAFLFGTPVAERLITIEPSVEQRLDLYRQVWQMILLRPWIGYGGGAFADIFPVFHQLPVSPDFVVDHAHSTYLTLWVELGLIAGSLPMVLIAGAAAVALRRVMHEENWSIPLATVGVIVIGALHSTLDFSLEIEANALVFVTVVVVGLAYRRPSDRPRSEQRPLMM